MDTSEREHDELINLLRVAVPSEYVGRELAYVAYLQGYRHGVRRARILVSRKLDILADVPMELIGRSIAMAAWMRGQCAGYETEISQFEEIDQAAIADWEEAQDAPAPMGIETLVGVLVTTTVVVGMMIALSGCGRHKPEIIDDKPRVSVHCKDGHCWRTVDKHEPIESDGTLLPPPADTVALPTSEATDDHK